MQLPLKQGLKLTGYMSCYYYYSCTNATSIKTRIETEEPNTKDYRELKVQMQLPLKQGLKHQVEVVIKQTSY